jgi:hypothetical protein
LQSSSLTQHNTKPQKTVKNAPKQKKKSKRINLARASFLLLYNFRFPSGATGGFVRARKEEQTTTTRPQKKKQGLLQRYKTRRLHQVL